MKNQTSNIFFCAICDGELERDAHYCATCGSLFDESAICTKHRAQQAQAVCIICAEPYCADCVVWVNDHFLCGHHAGLEIRDGIARVHEVTVNELSQTSVK